MGVDPVAAAGDQGGRGEGYDGEAAKAADGQDWQIGATFEERGCECASS
jgi:hypothetical protein